MTLPSPYYQDDWVTIYHGDCYQHDPPPATARLITDPPYGNGAYEHDKPLVLAKANDWVKRCRTVAMFGYPETLAFYCSLKGWQPSEWVVWWPTNKPSARTLLLPRESEHIAIFGEVCGAQRLFRPRSADAMTRAVAETRGNDVDQCRQGDIWRDPSPGAGFNRHLRQHINEKPLSLMVRLVELASNPGDMVFDPFAGSGTTLVAAKQLGRKSIGVEIEERYCEIAARRCSQEVLPLAGAA